MKMRLVKVDNMELRKLNGKYLLDVDLDIGNQYVHIKNILLCDTSCPINEIKIEPESLFKDFTLSGLFPDELLILDKNVTFT